MQKKIELITLSKPIMMNDGIIYEYIAGYWLMDESQSELGKYGQNTYIIGYGNNENDEKVIVNSRLVSGICTLTENEYNFKIDGEICYKMI